ncbi:MAG: prolipoprotein diacylglyceryl transferase, partial [Clostridia bacterium]|nr:prolipoprotein diacylglyceryl transferase [Clostridia bacterium]
VCCRIFKLDWRCVFDAAAPGVMIAQAIGRWGNFVNGEAYGVPPSESSPLYFLRMSVKHAGWSSEYLCSPTFLYESAWNVLGFILINIFYRKRKFKSEIFFWYATWYGFGRFFIEGLRTDSLYAGKLRVSQVVAAVSFVLGLAAIITFRILIKKLPDDSPFKKSWKITPTAVPATEEAAAAGEDSAETRSVKDSANVAEQPENKSEDTPDGSDN